MRNLLIVLSGPSGVGKGAIKDCLLRDLNMIESISCTTRKPRDGEKDGERYFFIDKDTFDKKIKNGELLEYSEQFGNYYGTPKDFVNKAVLDRDVILEIDVNGGLNIKKQCKNALLIFIEPPSLKELKKRLIGRNTETKEQIETRLSRIDYELGKKSFYDYVVVNDEIDKVVQKIKEIIKQEKNK